MRRTIEVTGIQNNSAAGARRTALMPMGLDYMVANLLTVTGTATPATITNLKEVANQEALRDITGADQDNMNRIDAMAAMAVDVLRIPFEMVRMKSIDATYGTTRNTLSQDPDTQKAITSYQLQWVDTTADTWRVFVEVDDATLGGPGGITRFQKQVINNGVSANSDFSISSFIQLQTAERRFFRRGYFNASAGSLANGDTLIQRGNNREEVLRRTAVLNNRILTDYGVRGPLVAPYLIATGLVIDTTETGISEMFDTMRVASDAEVKAGAAGLVKWGSIHLMPQSVFDIRFSPTAAGTLTALIETVGRF